MTMSRIFWTTVLPLLLLSVFPFDGFADLYQWQDRKGGWHIADDLEKVPLEYRGRARHEETPERVASPPQTGGAPVSKETIPAVTYEEFIEREPEPAQETYTVPYIRKPGGVLLVKANINDSYSTPLVLDTGASITVLSRAAAKRMGISLKGVLPRLRTVTANGTISNYLVRLSSIQIGDARVEDIMVIVPVRSHLGTNGLLGQNFLNEFEWSNNTPRNELILKEFTTDSGEEIFGGHGRVWWQKKFEATKEYLQYERRILQNMKEYDVQGPIEEDHMDQEIRIQEANVAFFKKELELLDTRANRFMVPRSWR